MKHYTGNIVPEPGTIFVFGSNPEGRHGSGSAKVAVTQFHAKYGQGEGPQGNAYALPTTELRPAFQVVGLNQSLPADKIIAAIKRLYAYCRNHPELNFKVAYRNQPNETTLCGYSGEMLMSFFKSAKEKLDYPNNIWFSEEWANSNLL
jgi:hypothetical protein